MPIKEKTTAAKPTEQPAEQLTEQPAAVQAEEKPKTAPGECVVDDGTPHTGRATPGAAICSAHAMRYKADGTPRG